MTAALYDQDLLDDPETPVFNKLLDGDVDLIKYLLDGDWAPMELGDTAILALAFEVDAISYELAPSQVPTVFQIEADIDAGVVPLIKPEAKHRSQTNEEDPEPEPVEQQEAAQDS
jgi:hypothetical protein